VADFERLKLTTHEAATSSGEVVLGGAPSPVCSSGAHNI
jgi:hypothetical protein